MGEGGDSKMTEDEKSIIKDWKKKVGDSEPILTTKPEEIEAGRRWLERQAEEIAAERDMAK